MARSVLVTGASSGIGRACVERLDGAGHAVIAAVRSDEAAAALRDAGSERLRTVRLDVTDGDSIAAAVREIPGGTLDGLVNNAGVTLPGPLEFLPVDDLREQLEINLIGQVAVTQAALPLLRRSDDPRIVNVSSIGGRIALPFVGAYAASKFGLEAVSDSLRRELRPWDIGVSVVEPGQIRTPIWDKGLTAGDELLEGAPPEAHELYGDRIEAMRRVASSGTTDGLPPDDVARVVEHALTARRPRTRYIVGREARMRYVLSRLLPDRAFDALVARRLRR